MSDPSIAASDPARSAWVSANAGAGKTYTLANRVARLLLAGEKPERILCLTFTKAAAAEMQERLFKQLGGWAMLPEARLVAAIAAIGGAADDPARARRLFASALETPGGLKILTLHAFCQIVLTRFPIEAGVPPAFEVLDDQTAKEMIADARQRVLERAGSGDAALAAAVALLVTETSEVRLAEVLDAALGADRRKLEKFLARDDVAAATRRAHGLEPGETAGSIAGDFCSGLKQVIGALTEAKAWLDGGSSNDRDAAAALTGVLAAKGDHAQFLALHTLLLTAKGEPRKSLATADRARARPDLLALLQDLQARYCAAAPHYHAGRAADLADAALLLARAVQADYAAAKRGRGVLDYDDLILKTRALVTSRSAADWVLYKLDGGIDHVLVDEAQDTSPEQWEIIRALTADFFAGESRARRTRTIFAVGDEKQSIFSFQGADPAQFEINRGHFTAALEGAGQALLYPQLVTSRRSAPQILSFVDRVFASEAARAGLTSGGGAIAHSAHRGDAKGGIEFWPALAPGPREEIDPYLPVNAVQEDSPAARLAAQIADRIAAWIRTGARLPGHTDAIRPGDIMILLPRREPFGGEVIRQLKLRGVPVAGADRVRLTQQIAAMDLMALGRFVLQRDDDLNLAALLRSPLCGMTEDELFALAHGRAGGLWAALAARKSEFAACHDFLSAMLRLADAAPPFEFFAHALIALGGKEKLLARLGPESLDAIEEFLSLALTHERAHCPSLENFLDWVARGDTEIKRDMERGRDEVRVMTVHGAKGLEADIVILPDTASLPGGLNRADGLLHVADGVVFPLAGAAAPAVDAAKAARNDALMKEHRRLFYVALTRARDRLCICGFHGTRGPASESWYELARAAAEADGLAVTRGGSEIRVIGTVEEEQGAKTPMAAAAPPPLPDWVRQPAPAEPAGPRLIRPSDILGAPPAFAPGGANSARFRRGLVVHALLARLPEIAPERRAAVALAFATARGFADKDAHALVDETLAVLDDPVFAAAFGPDSRAEAALLADVPGVGRVNGRIDRLAVTDDEILILDFKTNRPAPMREDDVSPVYLAQMALYRAGAERIFPGRRIVTGLVFTDRPSLLKLSDAILDAALAEIARNPAKTAPP